MPLPKRAKKKTGKDPYGLDELFDEVSREQPDMPPQQHAAAQSKGKQLSKADIIRLLKTYASYEGTQAAFCKEKGVAYTNFISWLSKYRAEAGILKRRRGGPTRANRNVTADGQPIAAAVAQKTESKPLGGESSSAEVGSVAQPYQTLAITIPPMVAQAGDVQRFAAIVEENAYLKALLTRAWGTATDKELAQ